MFGLNSNRYCSFAYSALASFRCVDGQLIKCEPAAILPLSQRYFLF